MIFKTDSNAGELNGFLDSGSRMEGELHFDTTFRIDGKLNGKVVSDGDLVVGEGGELEGETRVGQIFVSGTVRGAVHAARRVQIAANGRVFADLHTPSLVIEDGALFEGRCSMKRDGESSVEGGAVARLQPVPTAKEGRGA
jgi:cytoskeletal protein CcmA (bactofilin family)